MLMDVKSYFFYITAPSLVIQKSRQESFAGFASATDGQHGLEDIQKLLLNYHFILNVATCNQQHFSCKIILSVMD